MLSRPAFLFLRKRNNAGGGSRFGERLPFEAAENHPHLIRPRAARSPSPKGEALGKLGLEGFGWTASVGLGATGLGELWRRSRTLGVLRRREGATSSGLAPFGQLAQRGEAKAPQSIPGKRKGNAGQTFPLAKGKKMRFKAFPLKKQEATPQGVPPRKRQGAASPKALPFGEGF